MSARGAKTESQPIWFGSAARPLSGRLHRPSGGRARGGVVVCPPVGIELSHSHYVLRRLADDLCAAGLVVLRFDYDGTGQSAGEMTDPDRLDAWRSSVREALALVRGLGVPWLAGVGLRLGATLLADVAAGEDAIDALVLWDPCLGGRSFVRESVALRHAVCRSDASDPAPSGVEILGYELGVEIAEELGALELAVAQAAPERRVVVFADPARAGNGRLARRLPESVAEWHEYVAADELVFDTGEIGYLAPRRILGQLVDWLDGAAPTATVPVAGPSERVRVAEAVVGRRPDGREIVETAVTLGAHRLAGIECAPREGVEGPVVLLVSLAAEPSIGPVRQWVELARRWAADGVRSVRFDISGVGESPTRSDLRERAVYAHEHVEEILDVAAAVSPRDPTDVVIVGVCSGAYHALAAGPRLRPRGVVAVNPILTFAMPDRPGVAPTNGPPAIPPPPGTLPPLGRGQRVRRALRERMPRPAWSLLYALGLARSPAVRLRPLNRAQVSTLLMLGPNEAEVPLRRTPGVLARLAATGAGRVEIVPGLDHSLRDRFSRERFAAATTAFLVQVIGSRSEAEAEAELDEPAPTVGAPVARPV